MVDVSVGLSVGKGLVAIDATGGVGVSVISAMADVSAGGLDNTNANVAVTAAVITATNAQRRVLVSDSRRMT
jgi:hypothetical protein